MVKVVIIIEEDNTGKLVQNYPEGQLVTTFRVRESEADRVHEDTLTFVNRHCTNLEPSSRTWEEIRKELELKEGLLPE